MHRLHPSNVARVLHSWVRRVVRPSAIHHHGVRLPVRQAFSAHMRRALYSGLYELEEIELVRKYARRRDRVLEFGTGLGFITVACAQICGSENVATFEANAAMQSHILDTFRRNGVEPRLKVAAVARSAGTIRFYVGDDFWASSSRQRSGCASASDVPAVPFTQSVARFKPTFLILDIEGAEADLIGESIDGGVQKFLIETHADVIGDEKVREVHRWLRDEGFKVVDDDGHSTLYLERKSLA